MSMLTWGYYHMKQTRVYGLDFNIWGIWWGKNYKKEGSFGEKWDFTPLVTTLKKDWIFHKFGWKFVKRKSYYFKQIYHFRSKIPWYGVFGWHICKFDQKLKNHGGLWVTEHNFKGPLGEECTAEKGGSKEPYILYLRKYGSPPPPGMLIKIDWQCTWFTPFRYLTDILDFAVLFFQLIYMKRHWTSITSSPKLFSKKLRF